MSESTALAGQLAGVLVALGYPFYFLSIKSGKTVPSQATWVIWAGVGFMLLITNFASGTRDGIWVPVVNFLGPLITAIICFKQSKAGWEFGDKLCLYLAGASIALWWFTGSPVVALGANLVADACGCWPTIKKVYKDPTGEDRWAWGFWFVANWINLFAVTEWTFAGAAYPIYMMLAVSIIRLFMFIPRRPAP